MRFSISCGSEQMCCNMQLLELYPQTITISAIITLQEKDCATSIQSTDLSLVTTLLPVRNPKTGKNNELPDLGVPPSLTTDSDSENLIYPCGQLVSEKCSQPSPATTCSLHFMPAHYMSALLPQKILCFFSCFRLPCHNDFMMDAVAQGGVSVNVPQFFVPPVEAVSQVSVMNPSTAGAEVSDLHPHEKRRTVSLPAVCRESFFSICL